MADTKISALTEDTSPAVDSLVATVDDPAGTPASRRTTLANLAKGLGSATLTHQTDEASAEVLKLVGPTRATSADGDEAYISFFQDVDDGVEEMGRIRIEALDVSTGTEDSIIAFEARAAGSALSGETDFEIGTALKLVQLRLALEGSLGILRFRVKLGLLLHQHIRGGLTMTVG
ncbi:MAG: hypothetical protein ACYSUD_13140 [Planctomycetota bacterium]|jgi:hypothetical protein